MKNVRIIPIFANMDDSYYMKMALDQAKEAEAQGEVPIGAVIVCGSKVIARAHNLTETLQDATAHAEMQAITSATELLGGKYLNTCTLYVTLEPCPMCAAALAWSHLGRLVYGASDSKRGYHLFSPSLLHPKTEVATGVLEPECAELIKNFFAFKRS